METKEALERLSKYNNHYVKDKEYLLIDVESEEWKAILKGLERLDQIENTNPSEALNRLENICKILNEKRIDIKWLFKEDYNTIKQALLKVQEQEKELGCPLDVREQAFKKGFYDVNGNHYHCEHYVPYLKQMHTKGIMLHEEKRFKLEDYKKTWWLRKDKSE